MNDLERRLAPSDPDRRLELARETFRADVVGDAEVARAAARIGAKMRSHPVTPGGFAAPAAGVVALAAAVAYGATRGRETTPPNAPPAAPPVTLPMTPTAAAPPSATVTHGATAAPVEPATRAPIEPVIHAPLHRPGAKAPAPKPAPPRPVGWSDVNAALTAHDDARARAALELLGSSADPDVRAKARLGMAQLALARGDAAGARELATEVAGSVGVDPKLAARARELAERARR